MKTTQNKIVPVGEYEIETRWTGEYIVFRVRDNLYIGTWPTLTGAQNWIGNVRK